MTAVLDASALLAFLRREPGAERVVPFLGNACISAVNLSEVLATTLRDGGDPKGTLEIAISLGIVFHPFDAEQASAAAELLPATRHLGLSFGDRACLALGRKLGARALTADRAWAGLEIGVEIVLVR